MDGGYVCVGEDFEIADVIISLGLNSDWSFEKDLISKYSKKIIGFDASLNRYALSKQLAYSMCNPLNLKNILHKLTSLLFYRTFWNGKLAVHIQKFVGFQNNDDWISFSELLNEYVKPGEKIYLKVDIERGEYRILDEIILNQSMITGLAIEFHDCDLHRITIESFIDKLSLNIVNVNINNSGEALEDDFPELIEITFSSQEKTGKKVMDHQLNYPNNPNVSPVKIVYV